MSQLRLFLAFLLTLLLFAAASRFSIRPSEATYLQTRGAGYVFDHTSPGIVSGDPLIEAFVVVPNDSAAFDLKLYYRPSGQLEFDSLPLLRSPAALDRYQIDLPQLSRGQVYEYFLTLRPHADNVLLRLPKMQASTMKVFFEGRPGLVAWAIHVVLMAIAALYAFTALFNAFSLRKIEKHLKKLSRKVSLAALFMLIGTATAGAVVSHGRFGYYWGGWPLGDDLGQTWLALLIVYWIGLTVIFRGTIFGFDPEKEHIPVPAAVTLTLAGVLFMIAVYVAGGHFVSIPL